jgi:hypothetical protein
MWFSPSQSSGCLVDVNIQRRVLSREVNESLALTASSSCRGSTSSEKNGWRGSVTGILAVLNSEVSIHNPSCATRQWLHTVATFKML